MSVTGPGAVSSIGKAAALSIAFGAILGLTAVSGGCATAEIDAHRASKGLEIPVKFYDAVSGEPLASAAQPRDLELKLGAIAGGIWGSPSSQLASVPINHERSIHLDFDALSKEVSRLGWYAAAQINQATRRSIRISPRETQFLGVAQWVSFTASHSVTLRVEFNDSESGDTLMLMHFDKPCRLMGTLTYGASTGKEMMGDFDVDIESAGWVWLAGRWDGPRHVVYSRAVAPHPALVVAPPENNIWHGR
ncbi:MAG TPA: hypothetical protein VMG11_04425 [Steroidobacteraceae bacterium]|nr:hypothetical protein [Steroidobacteraceae bacterium]